MCLSSNHTKLGGLDHLVCWYLTVIAGRDVEISENIVQLLVQSVLSSESNIFRFRKPVKDVSVATSWLLDL